MPWDQFGMWVDDLPKAAPQFGGWDVPRQTVTFGQPKPPPIAQGPSLRMAFEGVPAPQNWQTPYSPAARPGPTQAAARTLSPRLSNLLGLTDQAAELVKPTGPAPKAPTLDIANEATLKEARAGLNKGAPPPPTDDFPQAKGRGEANRQKKPASVQSSTQTSSQYVDKKGRPISKAQYEALAQFDAEMKRNPPNVKAQQEAMRKYDAALKKGMQDAAAKGAPRATIGDAVRGVGRAAGRAASSAGGALAKAGAIAKSGAKAFLSPKANLRAAVSPALWATLAATKATTDFADDASLAAGGDGTNPEQEAKYRQWKEQGAMPGMTQKDIAQFERVDRLDRIALQDGWSQAGGLLRNARDSVFQGVYDIQNMFSGDGMQRLGQAFSDAPPAAPPPPSKGAAPPGAAPPGAPPPSGPRDTTTLQEALATGPLIAPPGDTPGQAILNQRLAEQVGGNPRTLREASVPGIYQTTDAQGRPVFVGASQRAVENQDLIGQGVGEMDRPMDRERIQQGLRQAYNTEKYLAQMQGKEFPTSLAEYMANQGVEAPTEWMTAEQQEKAALAEKALAEARGVGAPDGKSGFELMRLFPEEDRKAFLEKYPGMINKPAEAQATMFAADQVMADLNSHNAWRIFAWLPEMLNPTVQNLTPQNAGQMMDELARAHVTGAKEVTFQTPNGPMTHDLTSVIGSWLGPRSKQLLKEWADSRGISASQS